MTPASRWPHHQRWPLLVGGLWIVAMLVGLAVGLGRPGGPVLCVFKRVTGLPCPTCGGTRAAEHLVHGDVLGAFALNPLVFAGLLVVTAVMALRFVGGRRIEWTTTPAVRRWTWLGLAVLVLANWAWVIAHTG